MKNTMTIEQAYQAMIAFLEDYISYGFDELKPLLEEIKKTYKDNTHNPELWNEWLEAVKQAQEKGLVATRLKVVKNYDNFIDS